MSEEPLCRAQCKAFTVESLVNFFLCQDYLLSNCFKLFICVAFDVRAYVVSQTDASKHEEKAKVMHEKDCQHISSKFKEQQCLPVSKLSGQRGVPEIGAVENAQTLPRN